jgi:2-hydroxy-6-oxonona-2,4-dienedioate hydrolase
VPLEYPINPTSDVRWVDVDGVRTRLHEAGPEQAPPVVLLHGIGGHLEAFAHTIAGLAADHRVVAYDFPGHGWSNAPASRSYEVDGYVAHLTALLDELGIARADLLGLSLGGWVAGAFARKNPARVRRLVLAAPGGVRADPAVMTAIRTLSTAAAQAPTEQSIRERLAWLMAEITAPTLVIWGDQDATGPQQVGAELAGWLPAGRFAPLAGVGHWPQFEDPATFNASAREFLAS